jgi:hypothetical protein
MRCGFLAGVLSVFLFASASSAEDVPKLVTSGLDTYKTTGSGEAFAIWLKGSPLETDKTAMTSLKDSFTQVETMYGKMIGYDVLRTVRISSRTNRIYAEIQYEKGPLFLYMDCYRSLNGWIVAMMKFNTDADRVLANESLSGK